MYLLFQENFKIYFNEFWKTPMRFSLELYWIYKWILEGVTLHLNLPIKEQKYCIFLFILELLIWCDYNLYAHCGFILHVIYVVLEIEKFYDGICWGSEEY